MPALQDLSENALTTSVSFEDLLTAAAPYVDAIEVRGFESNRWGIALSEATVVELVIDIEAGKLFFSTSLGTANEGDEAATYKLLLQLATLYRENGGLRMGLDLVTESIVLIYDIPTADLDLETLVAELKQFIAAIADTIALLDATPDAADAPEETDLTHSLRI